MFHQLRWRIAITILILLVGIVIFLVFFSNYSSYPTGIKLGMILAAAGVIILVSYLIANWVTHPLMTLAGLIKRTPDGEPGDWSYFDRYAEIEALAMAIKGMQAHFITQVQELDTERSQLAAILFEMSDGVILVDATGTVRLVNPAACELFSVQADRVLGLSLIEAFRHHQLVEIWQRSQQTDQSELVTLDYLPRKLYLQCVATPLGDAQSRYTLLLLTDLTRLRQLETIRQDFIHNVSHELRTPLASLKAITETLIEGALDDPPMARKFLLSMETEVDSLSLMVSELLELSRIESGQVPLKMVPIAPQDLLIKAEDRLHLQAERAGLNIEIQCDSNLPQVLADPSRLEQVLVNLLHNAIKFTPSAGRIILRALLSDDNVIFSVQDSGIGIPAGDLNRIFERFYKIDRARRGGGTGLGLAISRHLVEAHGGVIWAESVEGRGSTFLFTIPLAH